MHPAPRSPLRNVADLRRYAIHASRQLAHGHEVYPHISRDEAGLRKLFLQFSFPGGIPSHASPECPGSIHLMMDAIDRLPQTGAPVVRLKRQLGDTLIEHRPYMGTHFQDMPEVRDWMWPG